MNDTNKSSQEPEYSFWAERQGESNYKTIYEHDDIVDINEGKPSKRYQFLRVIGFLILCILSFSLVQSVCDNLFSPKQKLIDNNNKIVRDNKLNIDIPPRDEIRIPVTTNSKVNQIEQDKITNMVDGAMPSLVSINATIVNTSNWFDEEYGDKQVGTGIIIENNEEEFLIVTNNHLVGNADKIEVMFIDGKKVNAEKKGTDYIADLAIISINKKEVSEETLNKIKVARVGESSNVRVGEMVVAIGNALGYGQSVTIGYISAKDRKVNVNSTLGKKRMVLLQTDAAINPGNSGGALLDIDGNVIGINTIKFSNYGVEGMGYAIPISRAIPIINELINREELTEKERGFLGIKGSDVLEEDIINYGFPIGVYVSEVTPGGGAEIAGILPGDIITGINDIEISSIAQLRDKVNSIRIGTKVKLQYKRFMDGAYVDYETNVILVGNPEAQ